MIRSSSLGAGAAHAVAQMIASAFVLEGGPALAAPILPRDDPGYLSQLLVAVCFPVQGIAIALAAPPAGARRSAEALGGASLGRLAIDLAVLLSPSLPVVALACAYGGVSARTVVELFVVQAFVALALSLSGWAVGASGGTRVGLGIVGALLAFHGIACMALAPGGIYGWPSNLGLAALIFAGALAWLTRRRSAPAS